MRGLSCVSTGCTGALRRNESCELLSWMETIVDRWKCACGELIYYRAGGSRDLKWVPVKMNTRDYNSIQGRHGLIVVFECIICLRTTRLQVSQVQDAQVAGEGLGRQV